VIARGWATVELERACVEHAGALRPGAAFQAAPDSELLGARCLVGEVGQDREERWLVLMEPSTEGRLSETLARHGEGWVATWEGAEETLAGGAWSATRPGPLGPERLRRVDPPGGPHHLVVATATIEP
jgi:hypothetical protein